MEKVRQRDLNHILVHDLKRAREEQEMGRGLDGGMTFMDELRADPKGGRKEPTNLIGQLQLSNRQKHIKQ